MTRKSKREMERITEMLEKSLSDGGGERVLMIGGDADRAGLMTPDEYRERYDAVERDRHLSGGDLSESTHSKDTDRRGGEKR